MGDNLSRLVFGLILGLFATATFVAAGSAGISFLLLLTLIILGVIILSKRGSNELIYPLLGIVIGVVLVFLGVSPANFDDFHPALGFLTSLVVIQNI